VRIELEFEELGRRLLSKAQQGPAAEQSAYSFSVELFQGVAAQHRVGD